MLFKHPDYVSGDNFLIDPILFTNKGIKRNSYKNFYNKRMGREPYYENPRMGDSYHFHEYTAKEYILSFEGRASNYAIIKALKEITSVFEGFKK